MAAYIELCILLEPGRCWAGLQEALGQETEPGIRVLERREKQEGRLLSHLPSCFPHELRAGRQAGGILLGMSLQDSGQWDTLEWAKEEDEEWLQEKEAHPSGDLQPLWGSSGGTGFMAKLLCPTALPAEAGISTRISTQTSLCPVLVWAKSWMDPGRNPLCRPPLSDIQTLWKWAQAMARIPEALFYSSERSHHRNLQGCGDVLALPALRTRGDGWAVPPHLSK